MAVRIRKDRKTIICAARSKEEDGDIYLDDQIHYVLSVEMQVLHSNTKDACGADLWHFDTTTPFKTE
jgi:hypothetical protein